MRQAILSRISPEIYARIAASRDPEEISRIWKAEMERVFDDVIKSGPPGMAISD